MLHRLGRSAIPWALLLLAGASDSRAQSLPPTKTITLGAELRWLPRWEGSDRLIGLPLPIFDIRPAGTPERFRSARDGLSLALIDVGGFRAGAVGKLKLPRKESEDAALRGLGDIGWAVELGGFVEYWWRPWLRTRAELRQGLGGHRGVAADVIADVVVPVTRKLTLSGGPRITLASNAATSPYFSITPEQALASGLPVFDAEGGVRSFGAGTQARYAWSPRFSTNVFVEYERLAGDAKRSPLVMERGSADQWMFGVGASYSFDW